MELQVFLMHLLGGMVNAFSIGGRDFLHLEVNQFRKVLRRDTVSSEEINRILEKIGREGMGSLTPTERASLQRATRR